MERLFPFRRGRKETRVTDDSLLFCCGDLSDSYFAAGNDSLVYRCGCDVVKVYNGRKLNLLGDPKDRIELIELYASCMNTASSLAVCESWNIVLLTSKINIPVRIVPVDRIVACSCCRTPATVSSFVNGPNLEEVNKSKLPFDFTELRRSLPLFSFEIGKRLDFYGISIVPVNIKYQNNTLFITDLCADLSIFGRKG